MCLAIASLLTSNQTNQSLNETTHPTTDTPHHQEVALPELGYDDDGMGGYMDGEGAGGQTSMVTPGVNTPYGGFGFGYGGAGSASPGAMLTPGIHLGGASPGADVTASPLGTSPFVSPVVSPGRATPGYASARAHCLRRLLHDVLIVGGWWWFVAPCGWLVGWSVGRWIGGSCGLAFTVYRLAPQPPNPPQLRRHQEPLRRRGRRVPVPRGGRLAHVPIGGVARGRRRLPRRILPLEPRWVGFLGVGKRGQGGKEGRKEGDGWGD